MMKKQIVFTAISSLIVVELIFFDIAFISEWSSIVFTIVFKIVMFTLTAFLWLFVVKFSIKRTGFKIKKDDFEELMLFLVMIFYFLSLLICFARNFNNTDLIQCFYVVNARFSWIFGFYFISCIKTYKRWKKTKIKTDLLFHWPIGKK